MLIKTVVYSILEIFPTNPFIRDLRVLQVRLFLYAILIIRSHHYIVATIQLW